MADDNRLKNLEARVAQLESWLASAPTASTTLALHPAWPLGIGIAAVALG